MTPVIIPASDLPRLSLRDTAPNTIARIPKIAPTPMTPKTIANIPRTNEAVASPLFFGFYSSLFIAQTPFIKQNDNHSRVVETQQ